MDELKLCVGIALIVFGFLLECIGLSGAFEKTEQEE